MIAQDETSINENKKNFVQHYRERQKDREKSKHARIDYSDFSNLKAFPNDFLYYTSAKAEILFIYYLLLKNTKSRTKTNTQTQTQHKHIAAFVKCFIIIHNN